MKSRLKRSSARRKGLAIMAPDPRLGVRADCLSAADRGGQDGKEPAS